MRFPKTIKALIKRSLRPLRPVRALILRPVEPRLSALEAARGQELLGLLNRLSAAEYSVSGVEARLSTIEAGWRQHLPGLLNAISTVGAFGHELSAVQRKADKDSDDIWRRISGLGSELAALQDDTNKKIAELWEAAGTANQGLAELWKRIEFVRKEILFEFKYQPKPTRQDSARIVSPEKFKIARSSGLKVNIGCGHVPREDYLNIDQRDLPGVDIVADAGELPFEQGSVLEIFSAHVLEHFPQQRLRRLLRYWRELLAPKGLFRAIVPDGEAMLAGIAGGTYRFEHFREVLFGAQEYEGDFHFNLLTPDSLTELLKEAGYEAIAVPVRGRKNDICFEFEIRAEK